MSMYLIPIAVLAAIVVPIAYAVRNNRKGGKISASKKAIYVNLAAFGVICLVSIVFPFGGWASAAAATTGSTSMGAGIGLLSASLAVGLPGIGGGYAVAKGASAGIGALSENPKTFGPAMVFVVLGEGIALYGLLIAILILNHVH